MNLKKNPSDRILELGGGDNPHPSCDINVDVRPGDKVHFVADFNKPLPIKDEDFNGVFSQFVIEHLSWRSVKTFLKEVFRIVKAGSDVFFITANTEAQIKWIQEHPEGWDGRDIFDSASCILFGDQNYQENAHANYMSPGVASQLFMEAGFDNVTIQPFGAIGTDMVIKATKTGNKKATIRLQQTPQSLSQPTANVTEQRQNHAGISSERRAQLFDRSYFNGRVYQPFYWDSPAHEITVQKIMLRKPESVLELGCGRGYVAKRLEDRGILTMGVDISRHCELTRASNFLRRDWADEHTVKSPLSGSFDLCFSQAFWEYIPEELLDKAISKMQECSNRGLHGIVTTDDGSDPNRCTIKPLEWWQQKMPPGHEVFEAQDLEKGEISEAYLNGDGKVKMNIGCAWTMFHNGWINCDVLDQPKDFAAQYRYRFEKVDARQGLTNPTETVDLIFACHMLEHLTYQEGLSFLKECRRVLKPTGGIRIIVPDAELLQKKARDGMMEGLPTPDGSFGEIRSSGLVDFGQLNEGCEKAKTEQERLWSLLYEAHLSCYDWETLRSAMEEAGFQTHRAAFREAKTEPSKQIIKETLDMIPCLSLLADGVPA